MNVNRQPSFVGINEEEGTVTVAYLPSWYHEDRCDDCPRYHHLISPWSKSEIGFCELMEREAPCEITGIGPEGVKQSEGVKK